MDRVKVKMPAQVVVMNKNSSGQASEDINAI